MRIVELKKKKLFGESSISIDFPENFKELSEKQFIALIALSSCVIDDNSFYQQFLGVPADWLSQLDQFSLWKLMELFITLNASNGSIDTIDFFFISRLGSFKAPEAKLEGMSFQQFMMIDTYCSWYSITKHQNYLNCMIASLYLKENESYFPEGDEKLLDLDSNMEDISQTPIATRKAILANWLLIRNWLSKTFPHLFPKGEGESGTGKPAQWLDLFDAFVGDNIHHMDSYKKLPCMDAFRILNRKIKNAK